MQTEKEDVAPAAAAPAELYSTKTLFTLGGSSTAVWLVTVVVNDVLGIEYDNHRWVGLLVALVLSFTGAVTIKRLNLKLGVVAFFNGLLIYVTTVGIHSLEQGTGEAKGINDSTRIQTGALIGWRSNTPWWPAVVLTDSIEVLKVRNVDLSFRVERLQKREVEQRDSIMMLMTQLPSKSTSQNDNSSAMLAQCQAANDDLRRKLRAATPSSAGPASVPITTQDRVAITDALDQALAANGRLMESLNKYLGAGNMNPTAQARALDEVNVRVNELKNGVKGYNQEIEKLRREVVGSN